MSPLPREKNNILKTGINHILKIKSENLSAILQGQKNFDIRLNDRDFRVGDIIDLREYNYSKKEFTGIGCKCLITYVLKDISIGLIEGYIVLSIVVVEVKVDQFENYNNNEK